MSVPFSSVLTSPSNMDFRAGGMGPPGAHVNQFADGAPKFPGGSLGMAMGATTGGWVPGKTGYYDWTTNGYATYHCSQDMLDYQEGDTGPEQLTFGFTEPRNHALNREKRVQSQRMLGLSQFNYLMQHDPKFRKMFGSMTNAAHVMKYFNFKGVQRMANTMTQLAAEEGRGTCETNFIMMGKARIALLWGAAIVATGHVGQGMQCHLLLRRHRYVRDVANRPETWKARDPAALTTRAIVRASLDEAVTRKAVAANNDVEFRGEDVHNVDFDAEEQEFAIAPEFGEQMEAIEWQMDYGAGPDPRVVDEPGTEYYWSWDPWVSDKGTNPGPEFYINRHGKGMYLPIGIMEHSTTGTSNLTPALGRQAQRAIYPDERGTAYQLDYYSLPTHTLELRVGQKFT